MYLATAIFLGLLVVWPYIGYPAWLVIVRALRPKKQRETDPGFELPMVTLVVSAFNEASVIRSKLENSLALDYPQDLLEILVISDASDDGTDEIVNEFSADGVRLARQEPRRGKSAGLTEFVPSANGEIIVFSDANAIYHPDAICKLINRFCDPEVGYVVGQQKHVEESCGEVEESETMYWKYETWIKQRESEVDSVVGGDGAIYAIRKHLFDPLRYDDINDFINPLQIITKGYRGVYEADAQCVEHASESFSREFKRKIRIVNRSIRALWRVPSVMNPIRHPLFAFNVISHKLIRWLAGFAMIGSILASVLAVVFEPSIASWGLLSIQSVFYFLAILGLIAPLRNRRIVSIPFFFCLANIASLCGVTTYLVGKKYVTWNPNRISETNTWGLRSTLFIGVIALLLVLLATSLFAPLVAIALIACLLGYTYVGYPIFLWIWPTKRTTQDEPADELPSVSVLIAAHNEAAIIDEKIDNTLQLDYPAELFSVVVVNDCSEDQTGELLEKWTDRIEVIQKSTRGGKAAAICSALESISADVILMTDANVLIDRGALRILVSALSGKKVGCATGNVKLICKGDDVCHEGHYQTSELSLQIAEVKLGSTISVDGALYAVRREYLSGPLSDLILDDLAVATNVVNHGMQIIVAEQATAVERASASLTDEFWRRVRLGEGACQLLRLGIYPSPKTAPIQFGQFVSHKLLRWVTPILAIEILIAAIAFCWYSGSFQSVSSAQNLFASLAIGLVLAAVGLVLTRKIPYLGLPAYFLVVCAGIGLGFFRGLSRSPSPAWDHGTRMLPAQS